VANPSEAEIQTQWKALVKYLDECRLFGNVTATNNIVSLEDAIMQALETDYADRILSVLASDRSAFGSILNSSASLHSAILLTYAKLMAIPETDIQLIIDKLYQWFITYTLRVKSRSFTFGAVSAGGGNVGNGTILRLNQDDNNFDIEAQVPEVKIATCVVDANSGSAVHEEVFEFSGENGGKDVLEYWDGSRATRRIQALSARQSLLLNPSFSDFTGTAALPTDITNWTSSVAVVGDGSDYTLDAVNYYRNYQGDPGPYALNIKLTRTLTQAISLRGTQLRPNVPYLLQVAWNRQVGGATGDLVIGMGSKTTTVVLAAQAGWNTTLVPSTPGTNCWFANFNEPALDISLTFTSTGGELLIDDVLLVPGTGFVGGWYWVIGGTTKFLADDTFTWTDTATESKVQRELARATGRYLPHTTGGGITFADP
jgi:hypothetical protein